MKDIKENCGGSSNSVLMHWALSGSFLADRRCDADKEVIAKFVNDPDLMTELLPALREKISVEVPDKEGDVSTVEALWLLLANMLPEDGGGAKLQMQLLEEGLRRSSTLKNDGGDSSMEKPAAFDKSLWP
jgi:hypothetical protein